MPEGYDYDCINADVLLNRTTVDDNGRIVLPDGMSYQALVLPEIDRMTPRVLRKVRDLVNGGAIVVGPKPVASPSLENFPEADHEIRQLAADVWGDLDGVMRNQRVCGKGKVVWGLPLAQVLSAARVRKDFEFGGPLDTELAWIHRRIEGTDIYFVANRTDRSVDLEARFRVSGREAELWHPDTGMVEPAGFQTTDDRTVVPLQLAERESVFVVFRHAASDSAKNLPRASQSTLATIAGPWDLSFQPNLGAPEKIQLADLSSWTVNTNDGVKYFSGTATYERSLQARPDWFRSGTRILLDLGKVGDVADVSINGRDLGVLWKPPYRIDVTDSLKSGENRLEIKVTDEWANRQIGDRVVAPEKRVFAGAAGARGGPGAGRGGFGGGPQTPADAGLIGPVTLISTSTK
jgi:hypothetical protein